MHCIFPVFKLLLLFCPLLVLRSVTLHTNTVIELSQRRRYHHQYYIFDRDWLHFTLNDHFFSVCCSYMRAIARDHAFRHVHIYISTYTEPTIRNGTFSSSTTAFSGFLMIFHDRMHTSPHYCFSWMPWYYTITLLMYNFVCVNNTRWRIRTDEK